MGALGLTLVATFAAAASDAPPEPDSYRQSDYRAPTPATLNGARVLTTEAAAALWRAGDAAFIDVLPQAPRPKNLPADVVWRDKPRSDIPGSLWLPDTGYGELAPVMLDYFRRGLDKALSRRQTSARVLLPQGLLDVLERGQARSRTGLFQRRLVSGGLGRLGRRRPAGRETGAGAAAVTVDR